MKYLALLSLAGALCLQGFTQSSDTGWIQLFNGKDLSGWRPKITGFPLDSNYAHTFRVDSGLLTVSYDQYDSFSNHFGHLFYEKPFSYYLIAVEYRFIGQQLKGGPDWAYKNSGIMLHCQPPGTMLTDQDFPVSIEAQLLGARDSGERPTANVCTPGTNIVMKGKLITQHCINSSSPSFRGSEWVRVEVMVLGDSVIKQIVNGDTVLVYEKPQWGNGNVNHFDPSIKKDGQLISSGYIALQSESHPVQFRKVEIRDLSARFRKKAGEENSTRGR